jgi:hypothetical protein
MRRRTLARTKRANGLGDRGPLGAAGANYGSSESASREMRHGLLDAPRGSIAERVLRQAPCPGPGDTDPCGHSLRVDHRPIRVYQVIRRLRLRHSSIEPTAGCAYRAIATIGSIDCDRAFRSIATRLDRVDRLVGTSETLRTVRTVRTWCASQKPRW